MTNSADRGDRSNILLTALHSYSSIRYWARHKCAPFMPRRYENNEGIFTFFDPPSPMNFVYKAQSIHVAEFVFGAYFMMTLIAPRPYESKRKWINRNYEKVIIIMNPECSCVGCFCSLSIYYIHRLSRMAFAVGRVCARWYNYIIPGDFFPSRETWSL